MKTVKIRKDDYDDFVYPAVALDLPKSVKDLRMADKVLAKLETVGVQGEPKETKDQQSGEMITPVPFYTMEGVAAEVDFEDAEATYLHGILAQAVTRIQTRRSRGILPILDALKPPNPDEPEDESKD